MIYLIITACIHNNYGIIDYESRKQLYLNSISQSLLLLPSNIKPIIVEGGILTNTYLNNINVDVVYTGNNSVFQHYKEINELNDIKHIINKYNIHDDDMIIKLTGRYKVLNDSFYNIVIDNVDKDIIMLHKNDNCFLKMYAIKCKLLKLFTFTDFTMIPSVEFTTFIHNNVTKDKIVVKEYEI